MESVVGRVKEKARKSEKEKGEGRDSDNCEGEWLMREVRKGRERKMGRA